MKRRWKYDPEKLIVLVHHRGGWIVWGRVGPTWFPLYDLFMTRKKARAFADDLRAYIREAEIGMGKMAPDLELERLRGRVRRG